MSETYTVTERLCLTEDDRLVSEDHPDARWLYATPGQEIPLEEAQRHGLMDHAPELSKDDEPPKDESQDADAQSEENEDGGGAEGKEKAKPADKSRRKAPTKDA